MTFWNTDVGSSMLNRKSTLMTKIGDKTTKLEQVLDEDDLLQQCSNKHGALIEFLARPPMVRRIIEYITHPVEENVAKYSKEFSIDLDPNDIQPPSFGVTVEQVQLEEKTTSDSEMSSQDQNGDTSSESSSSSGDDEENSLSTSSASSISTIPEDTATDAMDVDDDTPPDPAVTTTAEEIADELANMQISSEANGEEQTPSTSSSSQPATTENEEEKNAATVVANGHVDGESEQESNPESEQPPTDEKEQTDEKTETPTTPRREVPQETKDLLERIRVKYPYLCSEILASQLGAVLDCIMNEKHGYLNLLFEHIRREPPLDAVLTNYWRTAVVALTRRSPETIIGYFRVNPDILDRLIQHISDQSIMELVITLGWDPLIEELTADLDDIANWMREQDLIPKLIQMMSPNCTPKDHSAASYTLVDIVAKSQRCTNLTLFEHLSSGDEVRNLMAAIFVDNESSMLESLSVLIALLHHYPNLRAEKQMQIERERLGVSDNSKPNQGDDSSDEDDEADNEDGGGDSDGSDDDINVDYAEPDVGDKKKKRKKKKKKKTTEEDELPQVIAAVLERMDDFKRLLMTPPARRLDMSIGMLDPPLGPVRLKVVDLLVAVMRTPHPPMSEAFRRENIVGVCLNLFFEYPWNNLLHGSVEHIIQMTLSGSSKILKEALFEDNQFLNKILGARERSLAHETETGLRLGFTGHLTRISNTVVEFGKRDEYLDGQIENHAAWQKFMTNGLREENDKLNVQLGGHRPAQLDDDIMFHIDLGDKESTGKILEDLEMNMKTDDEYRMPGDEDLSTFTGAGSDEEDTTSPQGATTEENGDDKDKDEANGKNVDVDAFGSWPFGSENATASPTNNDDDGPHSSDEEDNAAEDKPETNDDPFDFDADFEFANEQPQSKEPTEQVAEEQPQPQEQSSNEPNGADAQPAAGGGADPFAAWDDDPFAGFDDASNGKGQETS